MIRKYIQKPILVEAIQLDKDNSDEIEHFSDGKVLYVDGVWKMYGYTTTPTAKSGDYLIKCKYELKFVSKRDFDCNYINEDSDRTCF